MTAPRKVLRVLITHEKSGAVSSAFRALGHIAYSCDLEPSAAGPEFHLQMYALVAIRSNSWDFIGMHPVCTFLTGSGIHWNNRGRGWERTEAAIEDVRALMAAAEGTPCYLENPVGIISSRIRKPDQIIQPYEFGDDASKKTCLWLSGLPVLKPDPRLMVVPRFVNNLPRWSNQTDSGQNKLPPSADRAAKRAATYPRIARAMAAQWSESLCRLVARGEKTL